MMLIAETAYWGVSVVMVVGAAIAIWQAITL